MTANQSRAEAQPMAMYGTASFSDAFEEPLFEGVAGAALVPVSVTLLGGASIPVVFWPSIVAKRNPGTSGTPCCIALWTSRANSLSRPAS
ncbi:hypothetical protein BDZ94DRAFT_1253530 [Collybia nuda]|uniref:Uncharacterized protein n=1 Tax=Collybia nuda TaxID=64659 RepID=A0A9P5YBD9_9AGAR|nr:hypothetical protein BDZ94DRAFT_1253530 [Collybia nuda]